MSALFRFPEAVREDPAVEAWFGSKPAALGSIAKAWLQQMRACGLDVREVMHDGCPTACVEDAAFAYVGVFKAHVDVGFFQGAELDDPEGLLEGTGKRMRHVKVRPGVDLDSAAMTALIRGAYSDMRARLAAERRREAGSSGRKR